MTRFELHIGRGDEWYIFNTETNARYISLGEVVDKLNEQQELIEELQVSDEMGWKRAEYFEKKCPKELHNKKMYIKRLEYKVQKFKEMNSEQQATIEMYQRRVDKREEQISIIKKHCLKFLTDEQIEIIRKELENEQLKQRIKELEE